MSDIKYEPSWGSVFLALARGEHLRPVICPHCKSEDIKPVDNSGQQYECTECGTVFENPAAH